MSEETTARGFSVYADFLDTAVNRIRVQESSSIGLGAVWIFASMPSGRCVNHWRRGGGWEEAPRPGDDDPPWKPGDPLVVDSEGWMSVSPHLDAEGCRTVIAALREHLESLGEPAE